MGYEDELQKYFEYTHLPAHLQDVSRRFHDIASTLVHDLPDNEERHLALRKLLEAKDCAVRSAL